MPNFYACQVIWPEGAAVRTQPTTQSPRLAAAGFIPFNASFAGLEIVPDSTPGQPPAFYSVRRWMKTADGYVAIDYPTNDGNAAKRVSYVEVVPLPPDPTPSDSVILTEFIVLIGDQPYKNVGPVEMKRV